MRAADTPQSGPQAALQRALPALVAASAMLAIAAALGVLPHAAVFVFKPLTTILILLYAWPRGADRPRQQRWVRLGLVLSLLGDIALMWPREGFLPGLIAFLLAHLAYIAAFSVPLRLAARKAPFVVYALVAAPILAVLWPGVPPGLRLPVLAYVLCLATMAAQAAAWWRAAAGDAAQGGAAGTGAGAELAAQVRLARRAAIGGALFLLSDALLATNKFAFPLVASPVWILGSYWLAQWCIASALAPRPLRETRLTSP